MIDDHAIVRRGIVEILTERSELKVVSEAADYGQLRTQLRQHEDVDLLVMDLSLPGKDGIEILKALHGEYPRLKVLIVSMYPEEQYAVRAFKAGASGYLNKASAPEKLACALSPKFAEALAAYSICCTAHFWRATGLPRTSGAAKPSKPAS